MKPNQGTSLPSVDQKLVSINPVNRLKNYFVGSHACSVVGWHEVESEKLLDDLLEWSTQPKNVYFHKWAADPRSKYHEVINSNRRAGVPDESIVNLIVSSWQEAGRAASRQ